MSVFLQLIWILSRRFEVKVLGLCTLLHYVLFWGMLCMTEDPGSKILEPINFWYFWGTTSLTIGYGDLSPQSDLGRLFTPIFQLSGIVLLTIMLGMSVQTLGEFSSKRRRGLVPTTYDNHILVIGDYHPLNTKIILQNAIADWKDDGRKPRVVGCFRNTGDANPFDKHEEYPHVHPSYVQANGEGFTQDTLRACGADKASQIYVMTTDDITSIGIVSLLSRIGTKARIVVLLNQDQNHDVFPNTGLDLNIVRPVQALLAVREMEDPGTSAVASELLSTGGATMYSFVADLPKGLDFEYVQRLFMRTFLGMVLLGFSRLTDGVWVPHLAVQEGILKPGDRLVYMASHDLGPSEEAKFNLLLQASN